MTAGGQDEVGGMVCGTDWTALRGGKETARTKSRASLAASDAGSGEGVVNAVRDMKIETNEQGQQTTTEGVDDKRLMVVESEFASVLFVSDARHHGAVRGRFGDS